MSFNVYSSTCCNLGEGVLWHSPSQCLFWLDINTKTIFQKNIDSLNTNYDKKWDLQEIPTALSVVDDESCILILSNKRIALLNFHTDELKTIVDITLPVTHRTNDGGLGPNNTYWFGVMEKYPTGLNGAIHWVSDDGVINTLDFPIGIPNTFVWNERQKCMYVSDSYQQKIFSFVQKNNIWVATEFVDISGTKATPDGGDLTAWGTLWNAQWDGSCIAIYDVHGNHIDKISLPALRPTNCCFGGSEGDVLFITTASEGLSDEQKNIYPLSGCVLSLELGRPHYIEEELVWKLKC